MLFYWRSLVIACYSEDCSYSVAKSCLAVFTPGDCMQHRIPCPSPSPRLCPGSCPLNQWCHPIISSSVALFSFCLQSFPMSRLFASGGQSTGKYSASASNEYSGLSSFRIDWLDLFAVQGILECLLHTIVLKHPFFGVQPSLWSNSHIHTGLLQNQ